MLLFIMKQGEILKAISIDIGSTLKPINQFR